MARLKSIIKIEGTLDGMTFYKSADGYLVRTKGGVNKNRIMNDPAFVRTRENMNEFSHVNKAGKELRQALGGLLRRGKDSRVSSRLVSVLAKVKKLDTGSLRGERQVSVGVQSVAGKLLLQGFDFNKRAPLRQILLKATILDSANGQVSIADFIPLEDLNIPEGATHISMSTGVLNYNFATGEGFMEMSSALVLPIDMQTTQVQLAPSQMPAGTGVNMYLFLIEFFQEVNGAQYSLRNGAFNVLHLLDVT
jgi:hypothetical protein